MGKITQDKVLKALRNIRTGENGEDIVARGMITGAQVDDRNNVVFMIEVDPKQGAKLESLRQQAEAAVQSLPGIGKVSAVLTAEKTPKDLVSKPLAPGVKKFIAVASGKGGVGKSTVAVNLAVALAKSGLKTGLLDADIYGPSIPHMLGLQGQKPKGESGKIEPFEILGLKVMSIGFMVKDEAPLIWRGPMVQTAIVQLLRDVEWGELDIMVVDMPPGTGDAQLTMAQKVPLAGVVIVSTPQDIALIDARKACAMFAKVGSPVLGIIENMSYYKCPSCGHEDHIFAHGGAKAEAEKLGVPFLGEIPLNIDIRKNSDAGKPGAFEIFDGIAATISRAFAQTSET
ncbi:MAG: Mrp/NBP35 family ATP-binding protein [Alphaproteobacteria bacterium]